jgi:hypothetical protein
MGPEMRTQLFLHDFGEAAAEVGLEGTQVVC